MVSTTRPQSHCWTSRPLQSWGHQSRGEGLRNTEKAVGPVGRTRTRPHCLPTLSVCGEGGTLPTGQASGHTAGPHGHTTSPPAPHTWSSDLGSIHSLQLPEPE